MLKVIKIKVLIAGFCVWLKVTAGFLPEIKADWNEVRGGVLTENQHGILVLLWQKGWGWQQDALHLSLSALPGDPGVFWFCFFFKRMGFSPGCLTRFLFKIAHVWVEVCTQTCVMYCICSCPVWQGGAAIRIEAQRGGERSEGGLFSLRNKDRCN